MPRPVFLFTDFTLKGPYVGQMHARFGSAANGLSVVDLMHDAPSMRPELAAYLLPAVCKALPAGAVVTAVVDPGVGSDRSPLIVEAGQQTFVGPDNGLLSRLPGIRRVAEILWRPSTLAPSFHGRDLFAPVAARIAAGLAVAQTRLPDAGWVGSTWPQVQPKVVYIDGYGNSMLGVDLETGNKINAVTINGQPLVRAETFSDVSPGTAFWYRNALGLLEIAVRDGSAADRFSLALGDKILVD